MALIKYITDIQFDFGAVKLLPDECAKAGIEVEIFVGGPGETVTARVTASTEGVDGVAERQIRRLRRLVEGALAQHLVERDALEVRRLHAADESGPIESGQRAVVGVQCLCRPPHALSRTPVRHSVNRSSKFRSTTLHLTEFRP